MGKAVFGDGDIERVLSSSELRSTCEVLKGGMTRRVIARKHFEKIKVVSRDTNDILTVLALSADIDGAIRQLKGMQRQREEQRKEKERERNVKRNVNVSGYGMTPQTNYSASNNWGLPNEVRVRKTAKGRLFFVNDHTK